MSRHFHRGIDLGIVRCETCGQLSRHDGSTEYVCPRCEQTLHQRKPNSLSTTWALLLTSMILYIPANTLPMMITISLGDRKSDTIMSGVIFFFTSGEWYLALIIFVASIMVPLMKMCALTYLLVSVQRGTASSPKDKTVLYRITEVIGRWSMVDVFVVAILAALVQVDQLVTIEPGWAALPFAGVVILTMLAAHSFDSRLIWDHQEPFHD